MKFEIPEGIYNRIEMVVGKSDTAAFHGSGLLEVFATPSMIALMENASRQLVQGFLPPDYNTVGTAVNIKHIKASDIGMKIYCEAELIKSDNRKLVFRVRAWDDDGEIGIGEHTRYIINTAEFMKNL